MRNLLAFIALIILTSCAPAATGGPSATPTAAAVRVTAQAVGTQPPTLQPPTVAASNTPAPTNTAVPSATVSPSATPAPTNTPVPVAATAKPSETPKPTETKAVKATETATDMPKAASTATPLARSASLAVIATETRVIATATARPAPTATATAILVVVPTATAAPVSSGAVPGASGGGSGPCAANPSASNAPNSPVRIVAINKAASPENVVIKNVGAGDVNVSGWRICSITGNQIHAVLSGTIGAGVQTTINSFASGTIWNNDNRDDGALYNASGGLVSYLVDTAR